MHTHWGFWLLYENMIMHKQAHFTCNNGNPWVHDLCGYSLGRSVSRVPLNTLHLCDISCIVFLNLWCDLSRCFLFSPPDRYVNEVWPFILLPFFILFPSPFVLSLWLSVASSVIDVFRTLVLFCYLYRSGSGSRLRRTARMVCPVLFFSLPAIWYACVRAFSRTIVYPDSVHPVWFVAFVKYPYGSATYGLKVLIWFCDTTYRNDWFSGWASPAPTAAAPGHIKSPPGVLCGTVFVFPEFNMTSSSSSSALTSSLGMIVVRAYVVDLRLVFIWSMWETLVSCISLDLPIFSSPSKLFR